MLCAFCHFELVKDEEDKPVCPNRQCPFRGRPQDGTQDASTGEIGVVSDTDENPTPPFKIERR